MIKVDAIRHYVSASDLIVEGFLGQQNPALDLSPTPTQGLQLAIFGPLALKTMYSPGQFGIDIYLPYSVLPELCSQLQWLHSPRTHRSAYRRFDPAGTERGSKRVPNVIRNLGRVTFHYAVTTSSSGNWCSRGGYIYLDVETHSADDHKTWTRNPVMEPFELHFGIRDKVAKKDPFVPCDYDPPTDAVHLTILKHSQAQQLASRLFELHKQSLYTIRTLEDGNSQFELQLADSSSYTIAKLFTPTTLS